MAEVTIFDLHQGKIAARNHKTILILMKGLGKNMSLLQLFFIILMIISVVLAFRAVRSEEIQLEETEASAVIWLLSVIVILYCSFV